MTREPTLLRRLAAIGSAAMLGAATAPPDIYRCDLPAPAGAANHGAAIAELPSGALLACWFSGTHEEDRSVRILCSRGDDAGDEWSKPWTAVAPGNQAVGAEAPDKSLGNVTLTVTPDGHVWMIHGVIQSRIWPVVGEVCRNWACGRIDARVSLDEGRTWSQGQRLVDLPGALPRAEPKAAPGGWFVPFYQDRDQRSAIALVALDGDTAKVLDLWPLDGPKLIQPALLREPGGRLRVYFRDQRRQGVYTAQFDPAAGAWGPVSLTNLPNPGSAVDVFEDDAGRTVLIYNPSATSRDVLALARTGDGERFETGCELSVPGRETTAAYPSVIRGRDGAWRVVYSADDKGEIKFVRFTSAWLEKCFSGKA